jgi:hypothetical protein
MTRNSQTFRRRILAITVGAACAVGVPVLTRADRPTTAPASTHGRHREGDDSDRKGGHRREEYDRRSAHGGEERSHDDKDGKRDRDGKGPREVGQQEWKDIAAFMLDHSPNKWRMFELIPEHHSMKAKARAGIVHRYRELRSLEHRDKDRYELELRRVRVEDDLFGVLGEIRRADDQLTEEQQKEMLRPKVRELWKIRMEDRELQVPRIQRQLRDLRLNETAQALSDEMEREGTREAEWVESRILMYLSQSKGRPGFGPGRGGPR